MYVLQKDLRVIAGFCNIYLCNNLKILHCLLNNGKHL